MSVDMMPVVPGSEVAPSQGRSGGKSREPARGEGSFADIVGRLVDEPASRPKPVRVDSRGAAKAGAPSGEAQLPAPAEESRGPVEADAAGEAARTGTVLMGPIPPEAQAAGDELPAAGVEVEVPAEFLGVVAQELLAQLASPVPAEPGQGDTADGDTGSREVAQLVEIATDGAPAVSGAASGVIPNLVPGASNAPPVATESGMAGEPVDVPDQAGLQEADVVASAEEPVEPQRAPAPGGDLTLQAEPARGSRPAAEKSAEPERPGPRTELPDQVSARAEGVRPVGPPLVAKGVDKAGKATPGPANVGTLPGQPGPADATTQHAGTAAVAAAGAEAALAVERVEGSKAPTADTKAADILASRLARATASQESQPRSRQATDAEFTWGTVASVPQQMAATLARAVSAAGPLRLEADVLAAKTPAAYQHASVSSGLPFSFDLQTALRAAEPLAQAASTVPVVPHQRTETQDVPAQIVQAAHLQWRDGVGEARLRLNPEHLGEVTISLRVEQGAVFASIRAESPAALQAIQARQQELQAALEAQGLHLDHFVASADPDQKREQQSPYRPPKPSQARALGADGADGTEAPRFEVLV